MRKISIILFAVLVSASAFAQTTTKKEKTLTDRAADHFMFQVGTNIWSGTADSVSNYIKGFNRSANIYVMYNKQFKNSPKFSIAAGIGVGTSNIYFKKMEAKITAAKSTLPFLRTDTGNNYKKYKLATAYLEIPLELRFTSDPSNPNKSIKAAIGIKLGTLLNAHTKGKTLQNAAGTKLNSLTVKESSKNFFNGTRIAATARVGYGVFSLYGSYGLTSLFKDGVAPDTKLIQIGLTISGL
jgi:Outer membrane protein beta-barrel domain